MWALLSARRGCEVGGGGGGQGEGGKKKVGILQGKLLPKWSLLAGAPNENIVQNHFNVALLKVF